MNISTSIILDTRRIKNKNDKYPVKLRVTVNRVSRNYQTVFDLSVEEFKRLSASRVSETLQAVRTSLQELKRTLEKFISDKAPSGFTEFENDFISDNKHFKRKKFKQEAIIVPVDEFDYTPFQKRFAIFSADHSRRGSLSTTFLSCIKKLLQQGRIGSAINYQRSYTDLVRFRGNVLLSEITVPYLYQYEQATLSRGVSKTTVAIILRPLRTVFNEAIEAGIIKREKHYPFGRRRYQIPCGKNIKKALTIDDVEKIYHYEPESEDHRRAKDFWLFCYFANGMNVKDMIHLKYKNIQGDYLVFERAKTERSTRRDPQLITAYLGSDLQDILELHGNKNKSPDNYIFPIMKPGLTLLEQFDLLNTTRSYINNGMDEIRRKLGIEKRITTIVSRHTFATVMKRSGVSTGFIQESLGHTDPKTTENYLGSFENSVKKELAGALTSFKHNKKAKSLIFDKNIL